MENKEMGGRGENRKRLHERMMYGRDGKKRIKGRREREGRRLLCTERMGKEGRGEREKERRKEGRRMQCMKGMGHGRMEMRDEGRPGAAHLISPIITSVHL